MSNLSDVINILPPMKSGNELVSALEVLPEYDASISVADVSVRLMALSDLYRIYVPITDVVGNLQQTVPFSTQVVAEKGNEAGSTAAI